jgi:hypothetical protein
VSKDQNSRASRGCAKTKVVGRHVGVQRDGGEGGNFEVAGLGLPTFRAPPGQQGTSVRHSECNPQVKVLSHAVVDVGKRDAV